MAKMNLAFRILTLSLFLFTLPVFAQQEKPPQSYDDAMEAFGQGDYKSAVDHFRQAIAERPSMTMAHYYLGISLYKQENYAEALSAYQELVKLATNDIRAHYQLAKIHLAIEDYRSAVEEYRWLASLSERGQREAGELAQYLVDMIPREIAEQYQLPASQVVYSNPSIALTCFKPTPRPSAPGDSTSKPQPAASADSNSTRQPAAPGDLNKQPPAAGVEPGKIHLTVLDPSRTKPAPPVKQGGDSTVLPMSANLRPTILYREKARYTEIARINKAQGTAVLNVVFREEGNITDIRVVRCLPDGLSQQAITAAERIRFNPAVRNGTPVSVRGTLEFTFNLY